MTVILTARTRKPWCQRHSRLLGYAEGLAMRCAWCEPTPFRTLRPDGMVAFEDAPPPSTSAGWDPEAHE